jgi:hypothetical protein
VSKSKANQKPDKERERLKSIQFARPGVARGGDVFDLSTLRTHRRMPTGKRGR